MDSLNFPSSPQYQPDVHVALEQQKGYIKNLEQQLKARENALEGLMQQVQRFGITQGSKNPKASARNSLPSTNTHPQASPASTPPRRNPNQLIMKHTPESFKPTKSVPTPPDNNMLQEFNVRFSDVDQIKTAAKSTNLQPLIPQSEILTLRGTQSGRKKIDLDASVDSLYNEACRISAIQTFHQIAAAGAYKYMNINLGYLDDIQFLEAAYNHYVHYLMANRYRQETKESGKFVKDEEKKAILKARQRLRDSRHKFGVSQNFPDQYLKILSQVDSHSDDEFSSKAGVYLIKKLPYRSKNATTFMCRVDEEIQKFENSEGK
ncbi:hypothetical protein O181_081889 [Austropuccinia psidii MF-1]|uniref:Uncharacterized protein n=1 Tax=Austropuccinia psidii MF-1 TaxID=1389203 RepID=A0A9Q3FN71_9BASI|nr:hypothetical protein [Austropuccinia psidii MF-1]